VIKKRLNTKSIKLPRADEHVKSALVSASATLIRAQRSPDEAFGDLFRDVQTTRIYGDGKTFADLVPKKRVREIKKEYDLAKKDPA
jgi:neutral trehalase